MIKYRELQVDDDFDRVVDLEVAAWSMDTAAQAVPGNMLQAIIHCGGMLIAAENDTGTMIGFVLGLPARCGNDFMLWSHMLAVHPDYQRQGIGQQLKLAQRRWALDHDYDIIGWTFDPLQRGNANFNLHKLGVFSNTYYVNFYGTMRDGINAGLPSDRIEVTWELHSDRVKAIADGELPALFEDECREESFLLRVDANGAGAIHLKQALHLTENRHFVEIPYNINSLKRENLGKALEWQQALRQVMQSAFQQGYRATDFVVCGQRCWYILERPDDKQEKQET
jgi:predicted GNAT superfamily acetyltransferase